MHILYLHQYYHTRTMYGGTRSFEFAQRLVAKGHRVTMITSGIASYEFPVPDGQPYGEFDADGIHVVSVSAGYNDGRQGTAMPGWKRMLKFIDFARVAGRVGCTLDRPDVVFATHTPLTIGLAGMKVARYFKVPFVFEVRDLWPQALINIGALRNPAVIWWLRWMERKIYAAADHIVALSPGMKAGIVSTGVAPECVTVITNASDLDLFRPDLDGSASRQRLGLGNRFAAVYFGAIGLANGLEYCVEAARILQDRGRDDIVIVLHGDGGKRAELEQLAAKYQLRNLVFSDLVPDKKEVARIVAGCNVCMTIYRATKEESWSPNKMFDALAAGRPVLINVLGWLGETIENNRCGIAIDPQDPQKLVDALMKLADNSDLCREMGTNARALAQREFSRDAMADRLEHVLSDAVVNPTAKAMGL